MNRSSAESDRDSEGDVDYRALADLRFAIRRFLAFSEQSAAEAGLSAQQHQALLTIKGLGGEAGLRVGALADRLLIRQHTAAELVDRLERDGLARRRPDPADGRRVLVAITEDGEQRLRALSGTHMAELRSMGPALMAILERLQGTAGTGDPQ